MVRLARAVAGAAVLASVPAAAQTQPFADARVQPPKLGAPQRGSLVGQYAQTAFGPSDVTRGTFSLPSPFAVPEERGELLASPFPTYSPESGLSEWGQGWSAPLAVYRWRARGDVDYATDERNGPWGRMVKGTDGYWYPAGLASAVRLEERSSGALVAHLADGSRWTLGASVRLESARGVYAWYLEEVEDATGHKTRFTYTRSPEGRPYVERVEFGGQGDGYQYRVELGYEPLALPFYDWRGGVAQHLDRRVARVVVSALHAGSGQWAERWRYTLGYEEGDFGPGFQLAQVRQTYASGEQPPATRYTYAQSQESLAASRFQPVHQLDGVVSLLGEEAFQPTHASELDIDHDGRLDFEFHVDQTLLVQEGTHFRFEALPPAGPDTVEVCRRVPDWTNEPRQLVQLWEGEEWQVVDARTDASVLNTDVTVCTRAGQLVGQQWLAGDWGPSPNTRLVDVNRDGRPDWLRVFPGGYEVLPNTSTSGAPSWGAARTSGLMPYFAPHTTWFQDVNGDGQGDLVSRYDGGLMVWYGLGNFEFSVMGQGLPVKYWYGAEVQGLLDYQLSFADVNKDGLTDVLLSQWGFTALFVNTGVDFIEVEYGAQAFFDGYSSQVVVGDFQGSGGTQLTTLKWGQAYAAVLDTPGTGLMRSADDGRGSVLRFEYAWSQPAPGARQRQSVLDKLTVESSGNVPTQYAYAYGQPVVHPAAKFLLGYGQVTRTDAATTQQVLFSHDENQTGLLASSRTTDPRTPGLSQYEARTYEAALFQGLPWKRLQETRTGWREDASGLTLEERTEYQAYEAGLCPSRTVRHSAHGTLTTEKRRASVAGLGLALHCLEESILLTGQHPDATLDFQHEARLTRTPEGLVRKLESLSPAGALPVQEVVFRPDHSVESVTEAGKGTTRFDYTPGSFLLRKVTAPDGTGVEATERDPLTDAIRALSHQQGTQAYTQSFRFDGQERLARQWDSLGQATETNPQLLLAYQYATALTPGSTRTTSLLDASTRARRELVEWSTAAGETVAAAQRLPAGWAVDGLTSRHRDLLETRTYTRASLPSTAAPTNLSYAELFSGAQQLETLRAAGFGHELETRTKLHADVERHEQTQLALVPGSLWRRTVENGTRHTTEWLDADETVRMYEDEAGIRYTYTHDALGRLRGVLLPDGTSHRARFDAHGRLARVEREGIATVEYAYDATSGLLSSKRFLSPAGVALRSETFTHDALGRQVEELHTDLVSGATVSYRSYYDGATPEQPLRRTHLGMLSAVEGPGFRKTFEYRADGKLTRRLLRLDNWRTVESLHAYAEDGAPREETTRVWSDSGALLSSSTKTQVWDAFGQLSGVKLNGTPLATFVHDENGRPVWADFGTGGTVTLGYDALTRKRVSLAQTGPGWSTSSGLRLNARGLVGTESYAVGGMSLVRDYGYSDQGFLTSAQDAQNVYAYGFDGFGLPTSIQENGVARTLARQGSVLLAGDVPYTFDALGRTVGRGDLTFEYGPHGHLARASRGSQRWDFLYDESGRRLLKRFADQPMAAYLENGRFLDATGLYEPVEFGGQLVGLVKDGVFQMVATDARGTVIADADGTAQLASPFGARDVRPDVARVLDYVEKGYDADLGLVRMGLRDYDPALNRFLTPDPLYLEDVEKCAESPVECNLYSYAKGDPVSHGDPEGTDAVYIAFPDYKIDVGIAKVGNLGHAGVLIINNKTGKTLYYEYGRYVPGGKVRTQDIPDVKIGKDGRPTQQSLDFALSAVSRKGGHGGRIEGAYFADTDFAQMQSYANWRMGKNGDPNREPYDITDNNCATFARDVIRAGGARALDKEKWQISAPNAYVSMLREHFTPIDHPGSSAVASKLKAGGKAKLKQGERSGGGKPKVGKGEGGRKSQGGGGRGKKKQN